MSEAGSPGTGPGISAGGQILVFNPGMQHAGQLSAGLVERGVDTLFIHGSPIGETLGAALAGRHRTWMSGRIVTRIAERLLRNDQAQRVSDHCFTAFDRRVARLVRRARPRALVGYEASSLASFRVARALGIPTILDAADVHFTMQDEPLTPFRARVNARKTAELALADHLLTCSALARDSYIAAGVPADRVHALTLGVELAAFAPGNEPPAPGPLRIAFVGRYSRKKGVDILAAALEALAAAGLPFECRSAADLVGGEPGYADLLAPHAELLGKVAQARLPELYRWADVMVLPSRFDSFGLVVLEALACGLPVLVSDRVGSKDFIQDGVNGAILPSEDAGAFAALLADFARDPARVRAMRPAAVASVRAAEWVHYRRRAAALVEALLAGDAA